MTKDIKIKENGVSKSFSYVDKINIKNIDMGSSNWIPESEDGTKVKTITSNGTYRASDEDATGYTVVFVNVRPTQVTGVDVRDGKTYVITVDENGYIVRTLVDE